MVGRFPESYKAEVRFAAHVLSALGSRLAPKATSTLLFIVLMRRSGALVAGTYSLSIAFLTSGVLLSSFGLEELIVREVAKQPSLSRRYLANTLLMRSVLALLTYGAVAAIATVVDYHIEVQRIILIQSLAIVPEGLTATMFAVFNANRKFNWMALVAALVSVFQLAGGGVALWMGGDLELLVWLLVTGSVLGTLASGWLCRGLPPAQSVAPTHRDPYSVQPRRSQPDWLFCKTQLRLALPFALIVALVSIDVQLDVFLLSILRGVAAVGIYSAARTVILALLLLAQAFRMAIYPVMAKAYATSEPELRKVYRQSLRYLLPIALAMTIACMIGAPWVLSFVYGDISTAAVWSLRILTLHLLVGFLYIPGTRLMIVSNHQALLSVLLGVSVGINILLNLLLVPGLGAIGTATSRATSSILYFLAVQLCVSRYVVPRLGMGPFVQH